MILANLFLGFEPNRAWKKIFIGFSWREAIFGRKKICQIGPEAREFTINLNRSLAKKLLLGFFHEKYFSPLSDFFWKRKDSEPTRFLRTLLIFKESPWFSPGFQNFRLFHSFAPSISDFPKSKTANRKKRVFSQNFGNLWTSLFGFWKKKGSWKNDFFIKIFFFFFFFFPLKSLGE